MLSEFLPPFGEIVMFYPNWKDLNDFDLTNLLSKILIVLLSVRFLLFNILYSVFNEHIRSTACFVGGLKWTRTTDLALIRRAL